MNLQRIVKGMPASEEITTLFGTLKIPSRPNSISLYNEDARNDLIARLLQSHIDGRKFEIVASGGSTTAGARHSHLHNVHGFKKSVRYYTKFANYLNAMLPPTSRADSAIILKGQGHGARQSLHTAIFYESFIPSNADLLFWEFSINDMEIPESNYSKLLSRCRQNLLTFLYEVGKRKQPPKVILVYYWNTPYRKKGGRIAQSAFEAIGDVWRQFSFVVGHVNMGAYLEESGYPKCRKWNTCAFLCDKHHASEIGHLTTAFMILNLLDPTKQSVLLAGSNETFYLHRHKWLCGTETAEKQILQHVITNSSTGWKSPLGAWTLELPVTNDFSSSRRLIAGQRKMVIRRIGKEDAIRQDRQRGTILTSCNSDPSEMFSVVAPREPMKHVRAILLNFKPLAGVVRRRDIDVSINKSSNFSDGTLVPVRAPNVSIWPCHFGWGWSDTVHTYWYIFKPSPIALVRSVSICSRSENSPMIQSIAVW